MTKKQFKIDDIPCILWGEKSEKLFIAIHGNMSHKEDKVIEILSEFAVLKGFQVLSFDLPEHGERKNEPTLCKIQNCTEELIKIMNYAKTISNEINLFACSLGAYFSLIAYKNVCLNKCLFLSPVVDMKIIINNMMKWFNISEDKLKLEKEIKTPIGQVLYWDYYCYVKENPIKSWNKKTKILYGSNDEICEFDTITGFSKIFNCELKIVENAEHFFHTNDQLKIFRQWVNDSI